MKIEQLDPRTLRLHALARAMDDGDEDSPRQLALADSIHELGILTPLLITQKGEVLKGARRLRAAKRYQLETIPCVRVPAGAEASQLVAAVQHHRGYTPAQKTYLIVVSGLLERAFEEAKSGSAVTALNSDTPTKGPGRPPLTGVFTAEEFAEKLGIARRTLMYCRELVTRYWINDQKRTITDRDGQTETEVTFREFFEPRLLREEDPYWVGYVLTAIKQILDQEDKGNHTGGRPQAVSRQLSLFHDVFQTELKRWEYWEAFTAREKSAHFDRVRAAVEELDPEKCEALGDYHAKLASEFKAASKRAAR